MGNAEWLVAACGIALAAMLLTFHFEPRTVAVIVTLVLATVTIWIAWQDIRTFTIDDGAILTIAVLAVAARWSNAIASQEPVGSTILGFLVDALVPGGLLYLFREIYYRRKGFDGLGFGDVKLAVAGGLLVGIEGFAWALASASLLALLYVLVGRFYNKADVLGSDRVAFGAALAPALWAIFVLQQGPLLMSSVGG